MENILILKEQGNSYFKSGVKAKDKNSFIQACHSYGQSIELLLKSEKDLSSAGHVEEIELLKPKLFLNLANANFQLNDFKACVVCCNTAILLCNDCGLSLDSLGIDNDVNEIIGVVKPVAPMFNAVVAKALYRRAQASASLENFEQACADMNEAHLLIPSDQSIVKQLAVLRKRADGYDTKRPTNDTERPNSLSLEVQTDVNRAPSDDQSHGGGGSMEQQQEKGVEEEEYIPTHNGGPCLLRRGLWSQSIEEVTVHIPLSLLEERHFEAELAKGDKSIAAGEIGSTFKLNTASHSGKANSRRCEVELGTMNVHMRFIGDEIFSTMPLAHSILPDESTWYILPPNESPTHTTRGWIVLLLRKAPVVEVFPGSEWWDRVFEGDEKIETLSCSVGSDISSLPLHARERAAKEHARFQNLSDEERRLERDDLISHKNAFISAYNNIKDAAEAEDKSLATVPERAEMLEALRSEFPNIQFTSK